MAWPSMGHGQIMDGNSSGVNLGSVSWNRWAFGFADKFFFTIFTFELQATDVFAWTPLLSQVMYRYSLIGYSYGQGQPMDCVWVGYLYDIPKGPPIQNFNECQYPKNSNTEPTTFIQDDTLYLKLGPISRFANGFELLYQGHFMNATLGLRYAEYGVTATRYWIIIVITNFDYL